MAKYYSSTFGKISGKHGNAVAVIRKDGSTYLRLHVPASNPRTDKQQAHRAKFALSSKALVPFNPIFKKTIGITNGISNARSYAFKNAIVGEYPSLSVDYQKLMFSFGPIEKLQNAYVAINEGVMAVSWDFNKMHNCDGDDSISFVVFNNNSSQAHHIEDVATRACKTTNIYVHDSWVDADLYLWAYVTRGDKSSDSVYVDKYVHDADNEDVLVSDEEVLCQKEPSQIIENRYLINLMVILCNLLSLFRQAFIGVKINDLFTSLKQRVLALVRDVDNRYTESVFSLNINIYSRSAFDVLGSMFHSIYSATITIPIGNYSANIITHTNSINSISNLLLFGKSANYKKQPISVQ